MDFVLRMGHSKGPSLTPKGLLMLRLWSPGSGDLNWEGTESELSGVQLLAIQPNAPQPRCGEGAGEGGEAQE